MSDLFGNHIVGFPTRWLKYCISLSYFKGEQHGFRKAENIQYALDGEFYFFSKVLGFEAADKHIKVCINDFKPLSHWDATTRD